jgi:hypothetical protein
MTAGRETPAADGRACGWWESRRRSGAVRRVPEPRGSCTRRGDDVDDGAMEEVEHAVGTACRTGGDDAAAVDDDAAVGTLLACSLASCTMDQLVLFATAQYGLRSVVAEEHDEAQSAPSWADSQWAAWADN